MKWQNKNMTLEWWNLCSEYHSTVLGIFYKIAVFRRCIDISALIKSFIYKNRFGATDMFVLIARQILQVTLTARRNKQCKGK